MRLKHSAAVGLMLSLPFLSSGLRLKADGPLHLLHHHGDCAAEKSTTVKLPAQNIRIETSTPRVVVNDVSGHHRARAVVGAGQVFLPMAQVPVFATFMPMTGGLGFPGPQVSPGSGALDAVHALERQHLEFTRQKAALAAEMKLLDTTILRVQNNIISSASPSASTSSDDVKTALENLSKRISDVERLLIIHDNILKENRSKKESD